MGVGLPGARLPPAWRPQHDWPDLHAQGMRTVGNEHRLSKTSSHTHSFRSHGRSCAQGLRLAPLQHGTLRVQVAPVRLPAGHTRLKAGPVPCPMCPVCPTLQERLPVPAPWGAGAQPSGVHGTCRGAWDRVVGSFRWWLGPGGRGLGAAVHMLQSGQRGLPPTSKETVRAGVGAVCGVGACKVWLTGAVYLLTQHYGYRQLPRRMGTRTWSRGPPAGPAPAARPSLACTSEPVP